MYLTSVILLLAVFPVISVGVESHIGHGSLALLSLKWFVFWACGIRLFIAGLRQVIQPGFTANKIFEIEGSTANPIVQELGFANLCIGLLGIVSLPVPTWQMPAALTGGLYYGLAGFLHINSSRKSRNEWIALCSDLAIFLLLAGLFVRALFSL
jgi:hypothetical protein